MPDKNKTKSVSISLANFLINTFGLIWLFVFGFIVTFPFDLPMMLLLRSMVPITPSPPDLLGPTAENVIIAIVFTIFILLLTPIAVLALWFANGILARKYWHCIIAACFWLILASFLAAAIYAGNIYFIILGIVGTCFGLLVITLMKRVKDERSY